MTEFPALVHHAEHPVTLDRTRRYPQKECAFEIGKPHGLWLSVPGDESWESFCIAEEFAIHQLAHTHRVTLKASCDVLVVGNTTAFDRFAAEYLVPDENSFYEGGFAIDWRRVVVEFDGIIIAPHRWDRRDEHRWYSGWDCASGCIWNLDAVDRFELVR